MRDDIKNTETTRGEEAGHQTLKFHFTPLDAPHGDGTVNPHARDTTFVPDDVDALRARFADAFLGVSLYANEHTVTVDRSRILDVCRFLHDELCYTYLADVGGIDRFTEDDDRFAVFYNLVSFEPAKRIRIMVTLPEDQAEVESVTPVYHAANWNERECWDMFGIHFLNHPDHRRMYMPEDFEYYPLRKEFPLLGVPGSLPLPPQSPDGGLTYDPFPRAHGSVPVSSYQESKTDEPEH